MTTLLLSILKGFEAVSNQVDYFLNKMDQMRWGFVFRAISSHSNLTSFLDILSMETYLLIF